MPSSVFRFDKVPFERRLAETIAWCGPRARIKDPKGSLRSESLCPALLMPDRASVVHSVVIDRSRELPALPAILGNGLLMGGRLLVYFPDAELADGAAEAESHGFFDLHNVPPWDTWIALADDGADIDVSYRQYVIAWVPPTLVASAAAGIDVNPEECIAWLDDTAVRARYELSHLLR